MAVRKDGFTLVEVLVALLIVSWALTSAYLAIGAFADQRQLMRERFNGQSVAWNRLMEEYGHGRGWDGQFSEQRHWNGWIEDGGRRWYWELHEEAALGRGVKKQTVTVSSDARKQAGQSPSAILAIFQVAP